MRRRALLGRREAMLGTGAGLMALPVAMPGVAGESQESTTVQVARNLNQLRAMPASNQCAIYDGAIFSWASGDYSKPPLGPADDVNIVKQRDVPLTTGAWARQYSTISVRTFGAVSGLSASAAENTEAFKRAIAAALALGFPLCLNGGVYLLDADRAASGGINFGHAGLHLKGEGATLRFVGAGRAFVLDRGGRDGDFLEGISIEDITILGGVGITDGFYSRGVVRSTFRNIEVRDVGGKAFWISHGVSSHYENLKYSARLAGQPEPPVFATHGLYIDQNGDGYYTANCVFTNPVMENFPGIGCEIACGSGNLFVAGTFEGCETGLIIASPSDDNMFVKVWMEANTAIDAVISGSNNGFLGPKFISFSFSGPNVRITDDAKGSWFAGGGYIRYVHMAAGSNGTTFHQAGIDENASGTIGFQGPGRYVRLSCKKIRAASQVVGTYDDIVGPVASIGVRGTWTPLLVSARGSLRQDMERSQGIYHKIGALVFAQCVIQVGSTTSPKGAVSINGLPFVSALRQSGSIHATQLQPTANEPFQVCAEPGSSVLSLTKLSAGVDQDVAGDIKAGTRFVISITYSVDE